MKSTNTRSMGVSSVVFAGGSEEMKSGVSKKGSGAWRVSSPIPGQACMYAHEKANQQNMHR